MAYTISTRSQLDLFELLIKLRVVPPFGQFNRVGRRIGNGSSLSGPVRMIWRVTFKDDKIEGWSIRN